MTSLRHAAGRSSRPSSTLSLGQPEYSANSQSPVPPRSNADEDAGSIEDDMPETGHCVSTLPISSNSIGSSSSGSTSSIETSSSTDRSSNNDDEPQSFAGDINDQTDPSESPPSSLSDSDSKITENLQLADFEDRIVYLRGRRVSLTNHLNESTALVRRLLAENGILRGDNARLRPTAILRVSLWPGDQRHNLTPPDERRAGPVMKDRRQWWCQCLRSWRAIGLSVLLLLGLSVVVLATMYAIWRWLNRDSFAYLAARRLELFRTSGGGMEGC